MSDPERLEQVFDFIGYATRKGLSQRDVAKLLRVSPQTIINWRGDEHAPRISDRIIARADRARELLKALTPDQRRGLQNLRWKTAIVQGLLNQMVK